MTSGSHWNFPSSSSLFLLLFCFVSKDGFKKYTNTALNLTQNVINLFMWNDQQTILWMKWWLIWIKIIKCFIIWLKINDHWTGGYSVLRILTQSEIVVEWNEDIPFQITIRFTIIWRARSEWVHRVNPSSIEWIALIDWVLSRLMKSVQRKICTLFRSVLLDLTPIYLLAMELSQLPVVKKHS